MNLFDIHSSNLPARRSAQREGGMASAMPSKHEQKETPAPITVAKGGRGSSGAYGPRVHALRR
jgi:hypothetical protein